MESMMKQFASKYKQKDPEEVELIDHYKNMK